MKICSYAPQLQIWCLTIGAHFKKMMDIIFVEPEETDQTV
ncbi:Uncharacterised protein [Escherichia coli]|nr:Uncharacterised protein [Escherichia coli]